MRIRATTVTAATASLLLVPLASPAVAITTTSTIVAYVADTNGNGILEMYTRPADGSGSPTRLFTNTRDVWLPALSPDGTKIAYLAHDLTIGGEPVDRLYVRSIDPPGAPTLLLDKDVTASVAWSKDGTKLVASGVDWNAFTYGTYIVNADGTGSPQLVPGTNVAYSEEPSFSPSGDQVALDAISDDGEYLGIDLITLSTGMRARIKGTDVGSDPVWSPDGQHILFQKFLPTCGVGLYRVPAGGGTPVTIREVENRFLNAMEYSRDGSQIFFGDSPVKACGAADTADIWVMNADGSSATQVAVTPSVKEFGITVAGGTPAPADVTAPAAPVINTSGTVSATSAGISWTADGDATDFIVLRKAHDDPAPTSTSDGTLVYHGPAHSATATSLTTGTAYDLYVFAVDSSGNTSPVSLPHAARPTAPPTMRAISRVGTATANTTFTVGWNGNAAAYQALVGERRRTSSVAWSPNPFYTVWIGNTTATSQSFTGGQGHSYYFKARGVDQFGNVTPWASVASAAHVPLNDTWRGFQYGSGSGWVAKASPARYLGTYRTTVTGNARVTATTDTARFVLIGDRCATCGRVQVYVDGVLRRTIDTYSSTTKTRQVLYASGDFGSIKRHTITLVSLPTAGRPRVSIDGLAIQR